MWSLKHNNPIPVFIVHWNRPKECMASVQCFLQQSLPVKISIVDNASSLENFQLLQQQLPNEVELIRLTENRGWGGGFNILLKRWLEHQDSPYCFISSHDALPQGECLRMLVDVMENDPEVGICCPEYGIAELPKYSPIRGPYLISTAPRQPGRIEAVDFAHQTLSLFRKQCIREIGLYDERHFAYGDEYEISLRARRHGWQAMIVWGAIVINPGSWTPKPQLSYLLARNTLLLALTYGGWPHAMLRTFLMTLNSLKISLFSKSNKTNFYPKARFLGIRDFLLGRYGRPPV
ncbi:MAG: glycosyltransferase family 2 protein [Anaerolineae bacterium]|nr:glycosyltransferase family 2 protein [Anaerolineae bacterium]MCB0212169.1 glycosyltransferase family 2 protein [Anaerolineae bacterium]